MPERETIPDLPAGGAERMLLEAFDRWGVARLALADLTAAAHPAAPEAISEALARLVSSGSLRETGGSYERTVWGRLQVAGPRELTLLGRPGCHLCEEALAQLQLLLPGGGIRLLVVDVDTDRTLSALYGNDVPIILLGKREIARHRVNREAVRRDLARVRLETRQQ